VDYLLQPCVIEQKLREHLLQYLHAVDVIEQGAHLLLHGLQKLAKRFIWHPLALWRAQGRHGLKSSAVPELHIHRQGIALELLDFMRDTRELGLEHTQHIFHFFQDTICS